MVVVEKKRPWMGYRSVEHSRKSSWKVTGPRIIAVTVIGLQATVIVQIFMARVLVVEQGQQQISSHKNGDSERQLRVAPENTNSNNRVLLSTNEEVSCVAWRATGDCRPDGPRRSHQALSFFADTDLSCSDYIPTYGSGYCELEVTTTSSNSNNNNNNNQQPTRRTIRAFQQSCNHQGKAGPYSLRNRYMPVVRCDQAVAFLNYPHRAHHYQPTDPIMTSNDKFHNNPPLSSRGIVIQIYPSALPSVYTIIRLLREVHQSTLPIELWHVQGELSGDHILVRHLLEHFDHVQLRTIAAKSDSKGNNSYMTKIHTIAYSQFDQVLFLDSDNFPFRDPTYLFDNLEQQQQQLQQMQQQQFQQQSTDTDTPKPTSAIFWKDFWNPQRNDYVMSSHSVVWELLGITDSNNNHHPKARTEMEMESGQMIIDRRHSKRALHVLLFLAETFSEWLEPLILVWGDKDLFRLAWYMTETPFHYIQQPPSLAGQDVVLKWASADVVCGITMVQHDLAGDPIFFHRNIAKLSTEQDLFKVWEKGAKFVGTDPDTQFDVEGSRSIYRMHGCYHPKAAVREYFQEIDYKGTGVEAFEEKILQFAREGLEIVRAA